MPYECAGDRRGGEAVPEVRCCRDLKVTYSFPDDRHLTIPQRGGGARRKRSNGATSARAQVRARKRPRARRCCVFQAPGARCGTHAGTHVPAACCRAPPTRLARQRLGPWRPREVCADSVCVPGRSGCCCWQGAETQGMRRPGRRTIYRPGSVHLVVWRACVTCSRREPRVAIPRAVAAVLLLWQPGPQCTSPMVGCLAPLRRSWPDPSRRRVPHAR
jgi:hypothetical protein